jgi:hypothetical protein
MAGGLLRFIDHGFVSMKAFAGMQLNTLLDAEATAQQCKALAQFSIVASVVKDRKLVGVWVRA